VAVIYAGRIVEEATAGQIFGHPAHPYTQGLLGTLPPLDGERRPLMAIPGGVPEPCRGGTYCPTSPPRSSSR
jgi:peptide/nickel transport system ATP-binding protein